MKRTDHWSFFRLSLYPRHCWLLAGWLCYSWAFIDFHHVVCLLSLQRAAASSECAVRDRSSWVLLLWFYFFPATAGLLLMKRSTAEYLMMAVLRQQISHPHLTHIYIGLYRQHSTNLYQRWRRLKAWSSPLRDGPHRPPPAFILDRNCRYVTHCIKLYIW